MACHLNGACPIWPFRVENDIKPTQSFNHLPWHLTSIAIALTFSHLSNFKAIYKRFYSLNCAFETLQEMLVRRLFAQCLETASSMIPMLLTYYIVCVSEGEISTCILMAQCSSDVTPGLGTGLMFLIQQIIHTFSGPFSYLWPSKISANDQWSQPMIEDVTYKSYIIGWDLAQPEIQNGPSSP